MHARDRPASGTKFGRKSAAPRNFGLRRTTYWTTKDQRSAPAATKKLEYFSKHTDRSTGRRESPALHSLAMCGSEMRAQLSQPVSAARNIAAPRRESWVAEIRQCAPSESGSRGSRRWVRAGSIRKDLPETPRRPHSQRQQPFWPASATATWRETHRTCLLST